MNTALYVFDLDGTLVESAATIYKSTIAAFTQLGISAELPKEELDKRIGAHFQDIFDELNITVPDFETFIEVFKGYYFRFMDDSYLFAGVPEVMEALTARGKTIALLTTKNQMQTDRIMVHFNLNPWFSYVMGRREGFAIKPSPQPLLHICKELGINPANTVMVGDSELDVRCGKAAGSKTVAVTYGYRPEQQLRGEQPDFIINALPELLQLPL